MRGLLVPEANIPAAMEIAEGGRSAVARPLTSKERERQSGPVNPDNAPTALDELILTVVVDNSTDTLSTVDPGIPQLPEVLSLLGQRARTLRAVPPQVLHPVVAPVQRRPPARIASPLRPPV